MPLGFLNWCCSHSLLVLPCGLIPIGCLSPKPSSTFKPALSSLAVLHTHLSLAASTTSLSSSRLLVGSVTLYCSFQRHFSILFFLSKWRVGGTLFHHKSIASLNTTSNIVIMDSVLYSTHLISWLEFQQEVHMVIKVARSHAMFIKA